MLQDTALSKQQFVNKVLLLKGGKKKSVANGAVSSVVLS
jgi:hypothetical protein